MGMPIVSIGSGDSAVESEIQSDGMELEGDLGRGRVEILQWIKDGPLAR